MSLLKVRLPLFDFIGLIFIKITNIVDLGLALRLHRLARTFLGRSHTLGLSPRLHGIGSKTIRIDMGTDRPCVYTGPGVSVYFWICYPNTFGFTFKSRYFWIRTLSIRCKRMDWIQKCTDRK